MEDLDSGPAPIPIGLLAAGWSQLDFWIAIAAALLLAVAVASVTALRHYLWPRLERMLPNAARRDAMERKLEDEQKVLDGLVLVQLITHLCLVLSLQALWSHGRAIEGLGTDPLGFLRNLGLTLATILVLIHGLVRGLARAAPERALLLLLDGARILASVVRPLVWVVEGIGLVFARALGVARSSENDEEAREEILDAVSDGPIADEEREMIENIIEVQDQAVSEVMTPRTSVFAIPLEMPLTEAVVRICEQGHSRIPVYEGSIDEVRGVLYAKDLLPHWGRPVEECPAIKDLLRRPVFVPETKKTSELLSELRESKVHMAIVLDEYGGMAGIVTIEDIIEEIVGEIEDEYDRTELAKAREVERVSEHEAEVPAVVHIDELNEMLDIELPEGEGYDTLGGFIFSNLGRVPLSGEECEIAGVRFHILEADERRIRRVKVTVTP